MPWTDTLNSLQSELAEVRQERLRLAQEEAAARQSKREQLTRLAGALGTDGLLKDMNSVLLQGQGAVETYSSWEPPSEETAQDSDLLSLDEDDEEDADYICSMLSWEEDGEREIIVDLGLAEDGVYLQVNEIAIRPEREALEEALLEAFREELQV